MYYKDIPTIKKTAAELGNLQYIPQPPAHLYIQTSDWAGLMRSPRVAVIGSRRATSYGRIVTEQLVRKLAQSGVIIVSGLALGIDSIAHQACLAAGGQTIAVLPSGLSTIYPGSHQRLAGQILEQGGALVSEYEADFRAQKWTFIERNRLVSGIADALLVTEAAEKSGTLHTASFALDQGRPVLAVPGNITSPTAKGTNRLIQSGAMPVLDEKDIFEALGIQSQAPGNSTPSSTHPDEQLLIELLVAGNTEGSVLLHASKLSIAAYNQALTMLEINGIIQPLGNNQWRLRTS